MVPLSVWICHTYCNAYYYSGIPRHKLITTVNMYGKFKQIGELPLHCMIFMPWESTVFFNHNIEKECGTSWNMREGGKCQYKINWLISWKKVPLLLLWISVNWFSAKTFIFSQMVWTEDKKAEMQWCAQLDHTLYLSFFLHGQNFWRIKFTPKNANFSR